MNQLPQRKKLPHNPPEWVVDGSVFFITICTEPKGSNQLCNGAVADFIFNSAEFNLKRAAWWPHLFLLMPDHVHALLSFANEPGMKKTLSDWKHYISLNQPVSWQRDFFDHRLRKDESFVEKAHYVRQNPVRAGLVDKAEDWPYVVEWPTRIDIQ